MAEFADTIAKAYAVEGAAVELGRGVHDGTLAREAAVRIPLRTMNRHGLIAGATGTGKTRTLQLLAEQLSAAGVSVFSADYKGDLSGFAEAASAAGRASERMADLGLALEPSAFPARERERAREARRAHRPLDGSSGDCSGEAEDEVRAGKEAG